MEQRNATDGVPRQGGSVPAHASEGTNSAPMRAAAGEVAPVSVTLPPPPSVFPPAPAAPPPATMTPSPGADPESDGTLTSTSPRTPPTKRGRGRKRRREEVLGVTLGPGPAACAGCGRTLSADADDYALRKCRREEPLCAGCAERLGLRVLAAVRAAYGDDGRIWSSFCPTCCAVRSRGEFCVGRPTKVRPRLPVVHERVSSKVLCLRFPACTQLVLRHNLGNHMRTVHGVGLEEAVAQLKTSTAAAAEGRPPTPDFWFPSLEFLRTGPPPGAAREADAAARRFHPAACTAPSSSTDGLDPGLYRGRSREEVSSSDASEQQHSLVRGPSTPCAISQELLRLSEDMVNTGIG